MRKEDSFDRISHAYVRKPGKNMAEGVCPAVGLPDVERALYQHDLYCVALSACGVDVKALRTDPDFPDGCFISDMALLAGSVAVLSNFSDKSPRQGEQQAIATLLGRTHFLKHISAPGQFDAADVLKIRDHFYIGLTDHTNHHGAEQLAAILRDVGFKASILELYEENIVRMTTAAPYLGRDRILIREELAKNFAFLEYDKIVVPTEEKGAANAFMVNGTLLMPKGYPQTARELKLAGIAIREVDVSEFEKMNGGLGCLSLRLPAVDKGNIVLMTNFKSPAVA